MSASPIAALVRVSTKGQSTQAQEVQIDAWAQAQSVPSVRLYVEHGVSGAASRRPVLDRLLRDVGKGGIRVVVVASLDRVARSTLRVIDTVKAIHDAGAEFVSLRERLDFRGPQGRLMLTVMSAFAEFERDLIRQRIRRGLEAAKARGVQLGRPGFIWDDDALAELKALKDRGLSNRAIAREKLLMVRRPMIRNGEMEEVYAPVSEAVIRRALSGDQPKR